MNDCIIHNSQKSQKPNLVHNQTEQEKLISWQPPKIGKKEYSVVASSGRMRISTLQSMTTTKLSFESLKFENDSISFE